MGSPGLQIEVGEKRTPFEFLSERENLERCQRYLYVINSDSPFSRFGIGLSNGFREAQAIVHLPVTMRTAPTSIETAASNLYQASNGNLGYQGTNLTLTGNVASRNVICITLTVAPNSLVNHAPYYVEANGNAAGEKYLRVASEI